MSRANLAGMGLKPFRYTGFPFVFAVWGFAVVVSGVCVGAVAPAGTTRTLTVPSRASRGVASA
jgi:hypothetical protein